MRRLLIDLGGFAGVCSVLYGLWGIYWPLAAIAGGATVTALCYLVARNEPIRPIDPRGDAGKSPV
jgi:hypothetical protein